MISHKILLYKHHTNKDGTHPVILQILYNRKPTRITLFTAHKNQWSEKTNSFNRKYPNYQQCNDVLIKTQNKVIDILNKIEMQGIPFTPTTFKDLFKKNKSDSSVFKFFDEIILELKDKGNLGNANTYITARNALRRYVPKKQLMFPDINYVFLTKLESFWLSNGCNNSGANTYLRNIRALFNMAIKRGIVHKDHYPFKNTMNPNGYSFNHLKSNPQPRSLSKADMEKIKAFPYQEYPKLEQAHKYFLWIYYARGMNFTDMAILKWKDIYNERIKYFRQKTGASIDLKVSERMQSILDYFNSIRTDSDYVFPILSDFHQTPTQKSNRIKKCRRKFNENLKKIGKICDIDLTLTSYVGRHTFANTLYQQDVGIEELRQSMGHKDIKTTENYVRQLGNKKLDDLDALL